MSMFTRLSIPHPHAPHPLQGRESIFDARVQREDPSAGGLGYAYYARAAQECTEAIDRSLKICQSIVQEQAKDIARLTRILEAQHMYVLVREDEAEQHKHELKNSIEPQIHQLLRLADEYSAEQETLEAQLREQLAQVKNQGLPTGKRTAARREELLRQHRDRLRAENQKQMRILAELKGR